MAIVRTEQRHSNFLENVNSKERPVWLVYYLLSPAVMY